MTDDPRLAATLNAIDAANAADPRAEEGAPAELLYARRMTETLAAFAPDASAHLRIAARGQHIERWTRPRADWPDGKAGYLQWREGLKRFHADRVGGIMAAHGWPEADRARVGALIRKEGIKRDAEAQTLENVICLTFMRWYFADFAAKHPPEKVADIVAKTARKMSGAGREAALSLPLPPEVAALLRAA
jgi:hypothetical protein